LIIKPVTGQKPKEEVVDEELPQAVSESLWQESNLTSKPLAPPSAD
jgi:hypothetical protein